MPTISHLGTSAPRTVEDHTHFDNHDVMPTNGWITSFRLEGVAASSTGETCNYKLTVYVGSSLKFVSSTIQVGSSQTAISVSGLEIKAYNQERIYWGASAGNATGGSWPRYWYLPKTGHNLNYFYDTDINPPSTRPTVHNYGNEALDSSLTYVANASPSIGTPTAPAASATGVSLTPVFAGNCPHPSADSAYDSTDAIHMQIKNLSTGSLVYDSTFLPSAQGQWSKVSPVTLTAQTQYEWQYRHRDTFGLYSGWSTARTFTTLNSPGAPTPVGPTGKLDIFSNYNYTYIYDHPTPLNANAVQVLLKNSTGTTTIADSGTVAISPTIASGVQRDTLEWHASLLTGTTYTHQARFRDTNNIWGPYSSPMTFRTDAVPTAPTNLSPADNVASNTSLLTCSVSDPDGDAITAAQVELVNASTNAVVAGFPKAMTVDANAGTASYQASGDMVLGTNYKWRASAQGLPTVPYGPYSPYAFFTYAQGPTVTLLSPPATRINLVKQPSAEWDPANLSLYWTESARSGTNFVDRVTDLDPGYGEASWEGTSTASGDNRFRTDYETVDATKAYFFQSFLKKYSGTAATHFAVECYNASNVLQGTLYPTSLATANGTDILGSWTRYGGIVWPIGSGNTPAFPATTTKVRVQITHSRNSVAVVRSDAVMAEQVATAPTAANWLTLQPWYGYGDPNVGGWGPGGYEWTLETGDSHSQSLPVVTSPPGNVLITYSSGAGLTKHSDRLVIQRWTGTIWASTYDSGWVSSTRTLIPVASNIFRSEERYRLMVQCRDTNLVVGSTPWVELDVTYTGPPEPAIISQSTDATQAQVSVSYELTNSPTEVEFAGVEFAREAMDGSEPLEIIDVNTALGGGSFVDHYPRSGIPYRYKLRQVKHEGFDRVQGRWAIAEQTVDYFPLSFIKDAEDPWNLVSFETRADALGVPESDVPMVSTLSWGQQKRSHSFGLAELKGGEVLAEFYEDATILGQPGAAVRFATARQLIFGRKTGGVIRRPLCLLLQEPTFDRIFCVVVGAARPGFLPPILRSIAFTYEETSWTENFYEREGWT